MNYEIYNKYVVNRNYGYIRNYNIDKIRDNNIPGNPSDWGGRLC